MTTDGQQYRMPARDVAVILEVDVLVVGGGFPGVCAAVGAARAGAKVAILERDGMLGGQAAEVYTFGLDAVCDADGRQIIKGLPWEIISRTVALGQADPCWSKLDFQKLEREGYDAALGVLGRNSKWKSDTYLDRNAFRHVLRTLTEEENVTVLLESPIAGAMLDGNRVTGVTAQGAYGPFAVAGKVVVDATPQAAVAAMAGCPFQFPEVYMGTHPHVSGIDIARLIEYACEHRDDVIVTGVEDPSVEVLLDLVERGTPLRFCGFDAARMRAIKDDPMCEGTGSGDSPEFLFYYDGAGRGTYWIHAKGWRFSRLDDPLHLSRIILELRRRQWLTHRLFRDHIPGFEHAHLDDIHPHIARALLVSREPGGLTDYDVPWAEIEEGATTRSDCIAHVMGHPSLGQWRGGWQLPYAALLAKGLEGLLVTGKPACRFIHYHGTCAAVGQAAGVAAALAATGGVGPRQLQAQGVREELRRQGALAC